MPLLIKEVLEVSKVNKSLDPGISCSPSLYVKDKNTEVDKGYVVFTQSTLWIDPEKDIDQNIEFFLWHLRYYGASWKDIAEAEYGWDLSVQK